MKTCTLFFLLLAFFSFSLSYSQNFWQQTNGIPNAPGNILSINVDTKGRVFVGVKGSGLYHSIDSGKSFSYVSSSLSNTSISSIIIDKHGHIFAGDAGPKGVFRSIDDGTTWTQVFPSKIIHDMMLDLSEVIYAGTYAYGSGTSEQGIFRSTDDGNNWEQIDISSTVALVQSLSNGPHGSVFAGGWIDPHNNWPRNLRSTDRGETWSSLSVPIDAILLDLAFAPDSHIVAGFGSDAYDSSGFLLSSDNGITWDRRNISSDTPGAGSVIFDDLNNTFFASIGNNILKSTDFGNSWFNIQTFYHSNIKLYIDHNGNIFAGNKDGLKRSTNFGNDWTQIDSGFIGYPSDKLTLLPGQRIYVNTQMGVFKLSNDRISWLKDSALTGSFVLPNSGNYFISDGEIHKSTDNGNSWTTVFSALSNDGHTQELIKLSNGYLLSTGVFSGWIHLGSSGILRSTDDGISWNTVYSKGALDRNSNISLPTITATTNDIILSGGGFNGVIRSTDLGKTWSSSMNGLPEFIACKVIRVRQDGLIFLGSGFNGVFRSTDKGLSWNEINNGLTSYDVRSIVFNGKGEIFIGTSGGVFKSSNNGDQWIPLNSGLLDISVLSLLCDSLGYLFAATSTTGIFRSVDPTTSVDENIKNNLLPYVLNQNYPNPFNPTTIISFSIRKSQNVELKVFDILGNEVAVLLNQYRDAGEHKVKFDGRNLSSGIYFYQLKAGDFIQTKKLIILR